MSRRKNKRKGSKAGNTPNPAVPPAKAAPGINRFLRSPVVLAVAAILVVVAIFMSNRARKPSPDGDLVFDTTNEAVGSVSDGVPLTADEAAQLEEAKAVATSILGEDHPVIRQIPNVRIERQRRAVYVRIQGKPSPILGAAALDPTRAYLSPVLFGKGRKSARLCTTLLVEVEHTINPDFIALSALPDGVEDDTLRTKMEVAPLFLALEFLDKLEKDPRYVDWRSEIPDARREIENFLAALRDDIVGQWRRKHEGRAGPSRP